MAFNSNSGIPNLLDPSSPPTVAVFDELYGRMGSGNHHEVVAVQEALSAFQSSPAAFGASYHMLMNGSRLETRFFGLKIIDDTIRSKWNTLSDVERSGLKNVLGDCIMRECESVERLHNQKTLVTKMNSVLVSIAKNEYPLRWPSFVQDIIGLADPSRPATVENTIAILGILGEEVFVFGEKTMTRKWVQKKKEALRGDFETIYMFSMKVLEQATTSSLVILTLETLEKYLAFVDPDLIFREDVLGYISNTLVKHPELRDASIKFLTEVVSITPSTNSVIEAKQRNIVSAIYSSVLPQIIESLPTNHNEISSRVVDLFVKGYNVGRDFVRSLCIFICTLHKNYLKAVGHHNQLLLASHQILIGITHVNDKEILKICIDYWRWLGLRLNRARVGAPSEEGDPGRQFFRNVQLLLGEELKNVRYALIIHMPRPEEVIIVENDDGEVVSVNMEDVEALELYSDVKEALWFFTRLDPNDTFNILTALMARQRDMSEWSFKNLSVLCWSVGSVAGALDSKRERELFIAIIQELLTMCKEIKHTKSRAVIASNIMYIVGQYDAFLVSHESFFRTVCNRLFYFMRETFEGVQDMAVDTLLKLAKRVPKCFLSLDDRRLPFIQGVIESYANHVSLLNFSQTQTFFEAIGCVIKTIPDAAFQTGCLSELMSYANRRLLESAEVASSSPQLSCTVDHLKDLIHLLRLHASVSKSCGPCYFSEISRMFTVFKGYYEHYFQAINTEISNNGPQVVNHQHVRYMRIVKKEVLKIFENFIMETTDVEFVSNTCLPQILEVVLSDYRDSLPAARDPTVIALVSACVKRLGQTMSPYVQGIMDCVFEATAILITSNHYDMPDHRANLFILLNELCANCFEPFLNYAGAHTGVVDALLFAIQHTDTVVQLTSLDTLFTFILKVSQSTISDAFFSSYMETLLTKVLIVAMDKLHAAALHQQTDILELLFAACRSRPADMPVIGANSVGALMEKCLSQIGSLEPSQISAFIGYCIGPNAVTGEEFKQMVHDFLIEVDVWGSAQENAAIEAEEKKQLMGEMAGMGANTQAYVPSYQRMHQGNDELA